MCGFLPRSCERAGRRSRRIAADAGRWSEIPNGSSPPRLASCQATAPDARSVTVSMKSFLKYFLATLGWSLHRIPAGIVTGHDLASDLKLTLGRQARLCCLDIG